MPKKQIIYRIGFNVDNSNLKTLEAELNKLGNMTLKELKLIDKTKTKQDLEEIKASASALGRALEESYNPKINSINIQKFNQSLEGSSTSLKKVASDLMRVDDGGVQSFRNLTAELLTTKKEIKNTSKLLDSLATTFANTIKWSISSSALNLFTGSIQKAWNYSQKLDESLNNIRIVTEKSNEEMEKFAKNANRAAKDLKAGTTNYTNAALIYYQQGLEEEDVAARTNVTVKAANVTGQSASKVSEQLTAVWNGYKVVAEEAELYVDKLAAVAATTAADLEELSTGMSKVASAANAMGVNVDQLSAQLATIVSVTRQDASVVGTALKTIYSRMGDLKVDGVDEFGTSLGDVSSQMQQMGIDVLDQQGNLREMGEVIEEVASKWGTWTDAQQQAAAVAIAGKRQYNHLIALFENWDMYESSLDTSKSSAGTLQKQQEIYADSLEAKFKEMGAAAERVYDAFFDSESMKEFLENLTKVVDKFGGFVEAIGGGGNLLGMLGSIGMRVFNNQLAQGAANFISNLGVMKANLDENAERLKIIDQYKDILKDPEEKDKNVISKMVEVREKELRYAKLLSEEEKKQLEFNIRQTAEIANQRSEEEKKFNEAEAFYQAQFNGMSIGEPDAERSSKNRVTRKVAARDLRDRAFELIDTDTKEFKKLYKQKNKIEDAGTISKEDLNNYKQKVKELSNRKKSKDTTQKLTESEKEELKLLQQKITAKEAELKIEKKLKELTETKSKLDYNTKTKIINLAVEGKLTEESLIKLLEEGADYYDRQATAIEKNENNLQELNRKQENIENSNNKIFDAQKIKVYAQEIINLTSNISGVYSGMQSILNINDILADSSLDAFEKVDQSIQAVTAGIATATPGIISSIKAIQITGTTAGDRIQKAFGWISLVMMAVTTLVAVGVEIYKSFDHRTELEKTQEQFDRITQSAEEAKNTLAELRNEYNGLMSDISKYRDAETAIDAMRVGTEEWQKATEQLNQQVEELVEKYPELRAELETDEYGNYRLNEDTISKVAATKKAQINEQKVIVAGANLAAEEARGKVLSKQYNEDYNSFFTDTNGKEDYNLMLDAAKLVGDLSTNLGRGNRELLREWMLGADLQSLEDAINASTTAEEAEKQKAKELLETVESAQKTIEKNKEATDQLRDAYLASLVKGDGLSGEVYNNLIDALGIDTEDPVHKTFEDDITTEGGWFGGTWWGREELKIGNRQYWVGDTIDNNEDVKQVQEYIKNYAKAAYGDNVKIDDFGQLMDTGFREIGSHKVVINGQEMSVDQLIMASQTKNADQINAERTEKITDEMKRLNNAGLMQEAAYFNSTLMGDATVDWKGATLAKLDTISKYKGADYKTKTDAAAETLKKSIRDILGLGDSTNVDVYSNLTETQVQHLKNSMDAANMAGAGDAIAKTVAGISDPTQMAEFQALLEDVNWTSAESINQFRAGLLEAGIEIDNTNGVWDSFINSVNSGMKQWIDNSKKVGENLAFIRDTVEGIELGSLISDEEYKKMVQINPEVAKYFVKTAGGMVAIANGKEIAGTLKEQYKDLGSIATYFENITKAVGTSQGNDNLKRDDVATPDAIKEYFEGNDSQQFAKIAKALGLSGADNLLDKNGIIAKAQAGDSGSIELLADMIMAVNQAKLDVANGEYNSAAAQQVYGTSVASSWSEATKGVEDEEGVETWADETTKQKVLDYWKTTYLSELGLNLSSELIKAFDISKLEDAAIAARKLELDYFAKINAELDKLGILIDQSFGLEKQKLLQEQIALQKENYQAAFEREQIAGNLFKTLVNNTGFNAYLDEETGEFKYSDFLTAYGGISETDENYTAVQEILSAYSQVNETAQAAAEASQAVIDAQIESFKYAIDIQKQYKETVKEWKKFSQDFSQFTKDAGVSAFAKTSVADTISNLMAYNSTAYGDYASNDAEMALSQMQAWANGGGENNPYYNADTKVFDEAAYQADYDQYLADYQSYIEEMRASGQELYDSWFSALDEISSMYDEQVQKLSTINSLLESSASLSQLFGNNSVQYYKQIRQNTEKTVELYSGKILRDSLGNAIKDEFGNLQYETEGLVQQLEKQFNAIQEIDGKYYDANGKEMSKEQVDAVWEAYTTAKQNHVDAIQAQYDAIVAEFETSLKELVNEAFGGSLGNTSELWNMQKSADSMYFDDVNAEYEMYKFEREAQKAIDATGNIAAQNKLKDVLNEQLAILQEKDKLGQYDIDRANAMYDLTLKQNALEEAQQTANKMKLTRDSLGNYTYQYVADEDKIAQAEEELAAAENNLYNLQKNHQSELIDTMISGVQEYQELSVKYMNDPAMFQEIQDHYSTFFRGLKEDMGDLGMNVSELTSLFNSDMSTPWMETFNNLAEIDTAGLLNSTAQLFSEDGGITAALKSVQDNFNDYLEAENGLNERLGNYITNVSDLNADAVDLAGKMTEASTAIGTLVTNIGTLVTNLEVYAEKYTTWLENAIGNESSNNSENKGTGKVVEEAATAAGNANATVAESTSTAAEASAEATSATNELAGRVDRIINIMAEEGVKIALNTDSKYSNSFEYFDQSSTAGPAIGQYKLK